MTGTLASSATVLAAGNEWTFSTALWAMLVFFFWFMAIWVFIGVFADILRRNDVSGWGKAGWIVLLFVLPFFGALIYLIARPAMTEQDRAEAERIQEAQRRLTGYSPAEEIEKLGRLRDTGRISEAEYDDMKRKAMISF